MVKKMEHGKFITPMVMLNMSVDTKKGKQINTWKYYNKKGKMTTEELYYTCDEKCEESHFPRPCKLEGKVKRSKDF